MTCAGSEIQDMHGLLGKRDGLAISILQSDLGAMHMYIFRSRQPVNAARLKVMILPYKRCEEEEEQVFSHHQTWSVGPKKCQPASAVNDGENEGDT